MLENALVPGGMSRGSRGMSSSPRGAAWVMMAGCGGRENGGMGMVRLVREGLGDGSCSITPGLGRGHHLTAGGGPRTSHPLFTYFFTFFFYIIGGRLKAGNKREKYAGNAPPHKDNSGRRVGGDGEFQKNPEYIWFSGDVVIRLLLKVSWSWERRKGGGRKCKSRRLLTVVVVANRVFDSVAC